MGPFETAPTRKQACPGVHHHAVSRQNPPHAKTPTVDQAYRLPIHKAQQCRRQRVSTALQVAQAAVTSRRRSPLRRDWVNADGYPPPSSAAAEAALAAALAAGPACTARHIKHVGHANGQLKHASGRKQHGHTEPRRDVHQRDGLGAAQRVENGTGTRTPKGSTGIKSSTRKPMAGTNTSTLTAECNPQVGRA